MKVVLISGHAGDSDRKTGFHFWADIFARRGMDVDFLTVGVSPLSLLKKSKPLKPPFNEWVNLSERVRKFIWMPPVHPLYTGHKILDILTWPLFAAYPYLMPKKLLAPLLAADLFVVENGCGLMLVPRLAKLNPHAKFIYNFSDRFGVVKFHPIVEHSQKAALPHFSLIRLNSSSFKKDFPEGVETTYIPQSIDKAAFDRDLPSPYHTPNNAVSIGDMIFDPSVIEDLAGKFPDWNFHLFGKGARLSRKIPNVKEYGEVPFDTLVPYLKHADIALAPYNNSPNAEYLSESSLKMVQYTYCRLPIVAPRFAAKGRDHVCAYETAGTPSSEDAFRAAMAFDRNSIDKTKVMSWDDVVDVMLAAPKKAPVRKVVLLVTSTVGTLCGVCDFTHKLADALEKEGMPVRIENAPDWNLKSISHIRQKYAPETNALFHLQYPSLGMGNSVFQAFFGLIFWNRPFFVTLHEFSIFSRRRKITFLANVPFIKKIIFTNEFERRHFLKYCPMAYSKTAIIPIGSNISVTQTGIDKTALPERIVYFGQIAPGKGIELFLETIKSMRAAGKTHRAAIIGSVLDEKSALTLMIRQVADDYGIDLLLNLPPEKVSEELHRSTIALLPFPDGITEKRGSAFACLKHGMTVITCHSEKTPEWLLETTYAIKTPADACAKIEDMASGAFPRHPNADKLALEMSYRQWNVIAPEHVVLYKNA